MKMTLAVALYDGQVATTHGTSKDDLLALTEFVAQVGFKDPHAEWTITASQGPDYTGRFGDIDRIDLTWEA